MLAREHAQKAQEFLEASDREFATGDILQASEKLWGAATHAVMSAAQRNGKKPGSHRGFIEAVARLAEEHNDASLEAGFLAAELFHRNFYYGFMEDFEIDSRRPLVDRFVRRVLALNGNA